MSKEKILKDLLEVLPFWDKKIWIQMCLWNKNNIWFLKDELHEAIETWEIEYMLWLWTWLWILEWGKWVINSALELIKFYNDDKN